MTKWDPFAAAKQLGTGDLGFYEKLEPELQKKAETFMPFRTLASTNDPSSLLKLNLAANPYAFGWGPLLDKFAGQLPEQVGSPNRSLRNQDVFKLLAAAKASPRGFQWLKPPARGATALMIKCVADFYGISQKEARSYRVQAQDLREMAAELGWAADELKSLEKELIDGCERTEDTSSKPKNRGRGKA